VILESPLLKEEVVLKVVDNLAQSLQVDPAILTSLKLANSF
jgi:hypothetical protein